MLYKHGTSAFEVPDRFRREKGGLAREETPGRSQILAGWTVVLVALLYSSMQPLSAKARSETQIIEQARP
jgi:hypothetical protein